MISATTTRRAFLGAAGGFLLVPGGCGSGSARSLSTPRPRSISALGDSLSDTVFFPDAFPHWLPAYFPRIRIAALGEAGDSTGDVLRRCRPQGIIDYTAIARLYGKTPHPAAPGQYCSVLAGVNDLAYRGYGAEPIISNLSAIYRYLRRHGSTPFPITILPWASSPLFSRRRERVRLAVNDWIRREPQAVDVERLMGDGGTPPALRRAFNRGDGIHPVGRGPKVLAGAVASAMHGYARR